MGGKSSRKAAPKVNVPPKSSVSKVNPASATKDSATGKATSTATAVGKGGSKEEKTVNPLAFRSWKTGTLDTPAFQPIGYSPKKVKPTSSSPALASVTGQTDKTALKPVTTKPQKVSAGVVKITDLIQQMQELSTSNTARHSTVSQGSSRATMNSSSAKNQESIVRLDTRLKDLVIDATGVLRNRFQVKELEVADGTNEYYPSTCTYPLDILAEIANLGDEYKKKFWHNHHVQIVVDLRESSTVVAAEGKGKGRAQDTILEQMAKLGEDFYKFASHITVDLVFPPPAEGAVAIRSYGQANSNQPRKIDYTLAVHSAGFKLIESLVANLDKCVSITFLEVVVHNPNASMAHAFTVEQLMYGLPFYDLQFQDWEMKWKDCSLTRPTDIGRFSLNLMDKERKKWLWAEKNAQRDAERAAWKEQERVSKMVFVRRSIAPRIQSKSSLPQPFPAPRNAASQYSAAMQNNNGERRD